MKTTLTLKKRVSLPPRALTRVALTRSAEMLRHMQTAVPAVIVQRDDAEIRRLQAEVARLGAERDAALQAAAIKAHREDRLAAVTIREVDNRAAWHAKQPKGRQPLVILTARHVITAEVWQQPPPAEG